MALTPFAKRFRRSSVSRLTSTTRGMGETVGYYNRDGDPVRNVSALVERGTPEIMAETGDVTTQAVIVRVDNDATTGIASTEIDTGGDEISVALNEGDTAQRRQVARVLSTHGGMTRVLCQ